MFTKRSWSYSCSTTKNRLNEYSIVSITCVTIEILLFFIKDMFSNHFIFIILYFQLSLVILGDGSHNTNKTE